MPIYIRLVAGIRRTGFFLGSDDKCCRLDKNGEDCIEVDTIDNIVSADVAVSMFNLGISTAELEILEGAQRTIEKNLPKILVFMGRCKRRIIYNSTICKRIK